MGKSRYEKFFVTMYGAQMIALKVGFMIDLEVIIFQVLTVL